MPANRERPQAPSAPTRCRTFLANAEGHLQRLGPSTYLAVCVIAALGVSLSLFAPRLVLLGRENPGAYEWARGLDFIRQCEDPFALAAQPAALRWRLLPAVAARALGLHGHAVFVLPWLGVLVLLGQSAYLVAVRTGERVLGLLAAGVIGTTTAVWTPTTWLGINDSWYVAALAAIAFLPSTRAVALTACAGPWIDERFIIGLPLAFIIRLVLSRPATGSDNPSLRWHEGAIVGTSVLLYFGVRFILAPTGDSEFVGWTLRECWTWLPWAPLGWFFGLRAAWLLAIAAVWAAGVSRGRGAAAALSGAGLAALAAITVLAADLTRGPSLLLPLVIAGVMALPRLLTIDTARLALTGVFATNVIMPALHVCYTKVSLLSPLPLEIVRLLRAP